MHLKSRSSKRRRRACLALLLACAAASCSATLQVTWPSLRQCRPAVAALQPDAGDDVAYYEVTVRRLPRLDRVYYETELAAGAANWTWRAVDLPAGTTVVLSIVGLSVDNATTVSAMTHAEVGLAADGLDDQACINRRKAHDRKGNGGPALGIIIGVLGGILFVLLLLVVFMCYRRRREATARAADVHPTAPNARLDQSPDSGGWGYMTSIVPGLPRNQLTQGALEQINNDVSRPSALQAARAWARRRTSRDLELPTYKRSQWEKAKLPKYDAEGAHRSPRAEGDPIALRPLLNPSSATVNAMDSSPDLSSRGEEPEVLRSATSLREGQAAHVRSRSGAYSQRSGGGARGELDGSASLDSSDAPIVIPHRRTRTEGTVSTTGTPRMGHAPSSSTSMGTPRRYI